MKKLCLIILLVFSFFFEVPAQKSDKLSINYSLGYLVNGPEYQENDRFNNRIGASYNVNQHSFGLFYRWYNHEDLNNILSRVEKENSYGLIYEYSFHSLLNIGVFAFKQSKFNEQTPELFLGTPLDFDYDLIGFGMSYSANIKLFKNVYGTMRVESTFYKTGNVHVTNYNPIFGPAGRTKTIEYKSKFGEDTIVYVGIALKF